MGLYPLDAALAALGIVARGISFIPPSLHSFFEPPRRIRLILSQLLRGPGGLLSVGLLRLATLFRERWHVPGGPLFISGCGIDIPETFPPPIGDVIGPILLRLPLVHLPAIIARRRQPAGRSVAELTGAECKRVRAPSIIGGVPVIHDPGGVVIVLGCQRSSCSNDL